MSDAKLKVHLSDLDDDRFRLRLDELLEEARCAASIEFVDAGAACDILVAGVPTRDQLMPPAGAPKTLIIPWSGVPRSVASLCSELPGLAVHNVHHNAIPVAEHAIGMLLSVGRRLIPSDRALRSGDWRTRFAPTDAPLIAGRRALILGAGAIARRIAHICKGLDVTTTLLARRRRKDEDTGCQLLGPEDLDEALTRAEILFIALPLTPATDGLIDARRLALLPPGAIVINVARGPILDEEALYTGLVSGALAGAGIDVWYTYPKGAAARAHTHPSKFPFGDLDHVVLSPHRAGHGLATERLCAEHLAPLLIAAAKGDPLPNRVHPELGY